MAKKPFKFFAEIECGERSRIREAIKQGNAIMALEGFQPDALTNAIDMAVIAGRVTHGQAADEMASYAKEHKSLDGFLESRIWIKNKTGEKTGM